MENLEERKYSANIEGATDATYTIPSVQYSYTGAVFDCVVSNPSGSVTSEPAVLTVIDDKAPSLAIDGDAARTTNAAVATITGTAVDTGSGMDVLILASDRFPGEEFTAVLSGAGAFTRQVPMLPGDNLITATASDMAANTASTVITVNFELAALPVITITSPQNGYVSPEDTVTLSGMVFSSLPADSIRLNMNDRVAFPSGADGQYSFSFSTIRLAEGPNTLSVLAETSYGSVSAGVTVNYNPIPIEPDLPPPDISITGFAPKLYINGDQVVISGTAASDYGISLITVNGETIPWAGGDSLASFDYSLLFGGDDLIEVTVVVTDVNGNSSSAQYVAYRDTTPPVIDLSGSGLSVSPAINSVIQTPYRLTGLLIERNPASLAVNNTAIGVLPGAADDQWRFTVDIGLAHGADTPVLISATDHAGNRVDTEILLHLDATVDIEMLSPTAGTKLPADGDAFDLAVSLRAIGSTDTDTVTISIDGADAAVLPVSGGMAAGTVTISGATADHTLSAAVIDENSAVLARTSIGFSVENSADIPVEVSRHEPGANDENVEPNAAVAFYFSRPVEPDLLSVSVLETVHGKTYAKPQSGASITDMSKIEIIGVDHDLAPVAGGMSYFPEKTMAAFYPAGDFVYSGTEFVTLSYDGQEISRFRFSIRPLPTFIGGFVSDQFMTPVLGIEVRLDGPDKTAVTGEDGTFSFGFGEPADKAIPAGRYLAVFNPDMKDRHYGTVFRWMTVAEGRLNETGAIQVPLLNPKLPFERISTGMAATLAKGELVLDFSNAGLVFADGRDSGAVHVQYMKSSEIAYTAMPGAIPFWVYSLNPGGVAVTGSVGIDIALLPMNNNFEYVENIGDRLVLVGLDPKSLQLVPVGVGRVDLDNMCVKSEGNVVLSRLDFIGYANVAPDLQPALAAYAHGEIGINQLIDRLENR